MVFEYQKNIQGFEYVCHFNINSTKFNSQNFKL